jgi:signal transduction histidine kinase
MLPGHEVLFSIVDSDRQDSFQILAGAGPWAARLVGREWPQAGTMAGRALRELRPVETTRLPARSALKSIIESGGIHSARIVPLTTSGTLAGGRRALGVIGFYKQPKQPFTPVERRLIREYAALVAFSLYQVELRAAAAADGARLETGASLAVELGRSLDPVPVVRRLLERAAGACNADRAALVRVEGPDTIVEDAHDVDGRPEAPGYRHPIIQQPLMAAAIRSGQAVLGGPYDVSRLDPPLRDELARVKHTATLPLQFAGRVIAVLVLSRRRDPQFSAGEVATLRLVGNLAVLALRNSWLFSEAQEASRAKGEFLNMAAHELRTPLTIITGYLSMLREGSFGPVPERWAPPLEMLHAKSGELATLVEDLLLASRLESGGLPAERSRVDLRDVVAAAVQRAEPRASLLRARLVRHLPEHSVVVQADPEQLGRVLDNLLNNSLTYSAAEPVVVVAVVADPEPVITVTDNGRGIPSEHHELVFERFYRLNEDASHPGTGLGLYISRELIGRASGSLSLEWSEVGLGSRFAIRLPLADTC